MHCSIRRLSIPKSIARIAPVQVARAASCRVTRPYMLSAWIVYFCPCTCRDLALSIACTRATGCTVWAGAHRTHEQTETRVFVRYVIRTHALLHKRQMYVTAFLFITDTMNNLKRDSRRDIAAAGDRVRDLRGEGGTVANLGTCRWRCTSACTTLHTRTRAPGRGAPGTGRAPSGSAPAPRRHQSARQEPSLL